MGRNSPEWIIAICDFGVMIKVHGSTPLNRGHEHHR